MENIKENTLIAEYDVCDYISNEIEFFKNNKQEFLVSILGNEEREEESVTDKEIEDHFYNDYYIGERCYEDLMNSLDYEFEKHIGKEIYVEGKNIGWRNLSGHKTFTLNKTIDMFSKIVPECDLTYKIEKIKENKYEVRISHHDSPMGENYSITIN